MTCFEKSKFQRWEFDKSVLFNKIEYIKRIAKDIHEIVVVSILDLLNKMLNTFRICKFIFTISKCRGDWIGD